MSRASLGFVSLIAALGLAPADGAAQDGYRAVPNEAVARTAMHYPESNEHAHEVWYDRVRGLGGAYLGVGSLQSYSIAAVQRADLLVLVDYDPVVARLHRAMIPLIVSCADVACLRGRLTPAEEAASLRRLRSALPRDWEGGRTLRDFIVHRPLLARELDELSHLDSWVSDADRYAHIRALATRGRIIARAADLRGTQTIAAASEIARAEGVPFRVVYLSNAEEYFAYDEGFVGNMRDLPADEHTLVLRTFRDRRMPHPARDRAWHYSAQPLSDFVRRMTEHGYLDSGWILRDLRRTDLAHGEPLGTSFLDETTTVGTTGSDRWWLNEPEDSPPSVADEVAGPRMMMTIRRAIAQSLSRDEQRAMHETPIEGAEPNRPAILGRDPLGGEPFVLSGEADEHASTRVDDPEGSLQALVLDSMARQVLPVLFEAADHREEAEALRALPVAADLYAAYRMRERLGEICIGSPRPRTHHAAALAACASVRALVRPPANERTFETFREVRSRLGQYLTSIARAVMRHAPDRGRVALIASYRRLATVAAELRPAG